MPGKQFSRRDSKSSSRSANNKPGIVNYYGAKNIGPVGPTLPGQSTAPILGTGVTVGNQSITERLIEATSVRATSGILGKNTVKSPFDIKDYRILTLGAGVQTVVTAGSKPGPLDGPADTGEENRFRNQDPSGKPKPLPPADPNTYEWNLPPHKWSLPTQPSVVNGVHYKERGLPSRDLPDRYRRGRIWWKANPPISVLDSSNTGSTALTVGDFNRKYGFQFLWNPEAFGTQVQVQLEATPSVEDRFLGAAGFFPATQSISFTIRLDRTNDFACAQGSFDRQLIETVRPGQVLESGTVKNRVASNAISPTEVSKFTKFYTPSNAFSGKWGYVNWQLWQKSMEEKLVDLFQRGTVADIEYLYKTINGPGPGSGANVEWINGRGIKTADIGYLLPTLVHVDIGPLSYDGYVTSLSVNHISFTPSMVPMRSDLTISLNVLATSAITATNPS